MPSSGERRDGYQDLAVGPRLHLRLEEVGPQLTGRHRPVDPRELDLDGVPAVGHPGRIGESGLLHQVLVILRVKEIALPLQPLQVHHVVGVPKPLGGRGSHQAAEVAIAQVEGSRTAGPFLGRLRQGRINVRHRLVLDLLLLDLFLHGLLRGGGFGGRGRCRGLRGSLGRGRCRSSFLRASSGHHESHQRKNHQGSQAH